MFILLEIYLAFQCCKFLFCILFLYKVIGKNMQRCAFVSFRNNTIFCTYISILVQYFARILTFVIFSLECGYPWLGNEFHFSLWRLEGDVHVSRWYCIEDRAPSQFQQCALAVIVTHNTIILILHNSAIWNQNQRKFRQLHYMSLLNISALWN